MSYLWRDFFVINKKIASKNVLIDKIASKKEFSLFMDYLKFQLKEVGFLYPEHKSKSMFENIQSMLLRSYLSKVEIQTLWGMIKKLRK